jgi:hypothetical protein
MRHRRPGPAEAKAGEVRLAPGADLEPARRERHFVRGDRWRSCRDPAMVRFHRGDILMDLPDANFDLHPLPQLLIISTARGGASARRASRPGVSVLGRTEVFVGAAGSLRGRDPRERIYRRSREPVLALRGATRRPQRQGRLWGQPYPEVFCWSSCRSCGGERHLLLRRLR